MRQAKLPDGKFLPRRARVECMWRRRANRGDLVAPAYIPVDDWTKGEGV